MKITLHDEEYSRSICCNCGIEFLIPTHYDESNRKDGDTFYCPNGHPLTYGIGRCEKLTNQNNRLKRELEESNRQLNKALSVIGKKTKKKKKK